MRNKQDCELKAFMRLAARLKARFPPLPILVLLDGLYANGPVMAWCRRAHWQFMIVWQDASLPSVWEEVAGFRLVQPHQHLDRTWGDRRQHVWCVNAIDYGYGGHERQHLTVHVVICEERWDAVDPATAAIVVMRARHAWLSSEPLTRDTVHDRCTLGARHRWGIESHFLVEKRHGCEYEHGFSQNWQAMTGYHFLMRLSHLINILASHTARLAAGRAAGRPRAHPVSARHLRRAVAGPGTHPGRLGVALPDSSGAAATHDSAAFRPHAWSRHRCPRTHATDAAASRIHPEIAPPITSHHRALADTPGSFSVEVPSAPMSTPLAGVCVSAGFRQALKRPPGTVNLTWQAGPGSQ